MPNAPFYQEGNYVAEITAQALGKANTGTNQFVLRFKILGTPTDDGNYAQDAFHYERTIYLYLTEKTMPFVVEALEKLGYNGNGFGPLDPSNSQHQSFVGNQIDVYCNHETDNNGQIREKWRLNTGSPGLKITPLEAKEVRELDALFGKSLKNPAVTRPVPVATNGTEITDDDIPF